MQLLHHSCADVALQLAGDAKVFYFGVVTKVEGSVLAEIQITIVVLLDSWIRRASHHQSKCHQR